MVFIESVRLSNFKSYHFTRDFGPLLRTNAIIGPNGTGKSNILDAITFALGDVRQNLRVEKLKDLIHVSPSHDPESSCSVAVRLTFDGDEKVYEVERRIKRSGSEDFLINEEKRTRQEYMEFLEEHGIFAKHDNFVVRQGTIDKMIKDGENNRTKFIDTVSGSSKYESNCKEYQKTHEELLKQLRDHQDNSERTGKELHRLSIASTKRKDIEDMLQKLSDVRTDQFLIQMFPIEKELEALEAKYQKEKTKLEAKLDGNVEDLSEAYSQKQEEVSELKNETKQLKTQKNQAELEAAAAKNSMDANNLKISHLENKLSTSEKMLRALDAKTQEKKDDRKAIERRIAELEKEVESINSEVRRQSQTALSEAEIAKFHKLQQFIDDDAVTGELKSKEDKLDLLQKELQSFKNALDIEEEKFKFKERELELLQSNDPEQARWNEMKNQLAEIEAEIEKIKENNAKRAEYTKEYSELQYKLADQERYTDARRKEQVREQIEKEFLEKFPNEVFGILKKICVPIDDSYTLAGARVFQKWQNAFIVNSAETATKCIQILKTRKCPPQKFIPVDDSLRTRQATSDVNAVLRSGQARLVREFFNIRHDNPAVARAVDFVCGTILICDTAEQASRVAYGDGRRLTTVSKDGTLFNRNGKLTGGAAALTQHGDPFNQSQAQINASRLAELTYLLKDLPRSDEGLMNAKKAQRNQLRQRIAQLESQRPALAKDKEQRIESIRKLLDVIQAAIDQKRGMVELTETKIQELQAEIQELKARKEALTKETFADFCERNNISDVRVFQAEDVELQKTFAEKRSNLMNQIKQLQIELQYLSDARSDERARAEAKVEDVKAELAEAQTAWAKARDENNEKHEAFTKVFAEFDEKEKELEELLTQLKDIKEKIKKNKDIKTKIDKLTKNKNSSFDSLIDELSKIIFECRVKQISLPLVNGANFDDIEMFESTEDSPAETQKIPLASIKADYSKLGEEEAQLSNAGYRQKLINSKVKEIAELEKQLTLKEAGAISVDAYNEKIRKAKEEERENMAKFSELSKQITEAKRRLQETKTERKNLFMATFKEMQKSVDYYYKLLYHDATAQAYITLNGSDEPYNSKILFDLVVPGKNRASIDSLSGGEKAMAILALLFAGKPRNVHCVLMDEFDEALDRRNMNLVSKFIDHMSRKNIQFIFISHRIELYAHANRLIGSSTHCGQCDYGSIIYTIDVRDYLSESVQDKYDPDDESEVAKKNQATEEFDKVLEIPLDGGEEKEEEAEMDEEVVNEIMKLYGSEEVKDFLKAVEAEDAFRKCSNNEDLKEMQELYAKINLGDMSF